MSDRPREQGHPAASAAASRPTADDAPSSAVASPNTPNEPYPRPSYTSASAPGSRTASRQSSIHLRPVELPPLPRLPNISGGSFSPASRSAGVASILNPVDTNDAVGEGRRRKASQMMEGSGPTATFLPPPATNDSGPAPASHGLTAASPMSIASALGDRAPRRILTPRSPSIHRATSLTQLNPPSATINAQQSPFMGSPRSKTYSLEPGTGGVPPMPTPPANLRNAYGFPHTSSPVDSTRRASTGATHAPPQPPSESTSPTSSYGQPGHGSPGAHHTPAPLPRYGELSSGAQHDPQQRSASIPMLSTSSSAAYQMMTISTSSGPVHLPVDMQAASRVADEKRRRNAGASARFRQRRKEKEKEASTMISRLEQQVKELTEDLAYYKRERELMATALLQAPGGDRHFPRPPSPRQRRISNPMQGGGAPSGSGAMYNPIHDQPGRSPDEGRNVRRRVSALPLPPPPPPPQQQQGQLPNPGTQYAPPSHAHQGYGPPLAPQPAPPAQHGPPTLGRPSLPAPTSAGGPPSLMHAPPHTGPWNPYAHDRRGAPPPLPGTTSPTSRDGR